MKKSILSFVFVMAMILSFGQTSTDKVLNGVGSEVTALHSDTKDAISTLHQDAQAIVATAYADGKGVLGTLYSDANKIIQYAAPKLEAGLVMLAQTLKTTVAEVYRVLTLKHLAISISYLFVGLFAIIFGIFAYKIVNFPAEKLLQSRADEYGKISWKPQWAFMLMASLISSIALFIVFFINLQTMFIGLIAPQAGAIQDIVNLVDTLLK
jgi:hypothetical protein